MGCGQSKIENEEAVSRCKDRKRFMKDSVAARNAFAAAHFTYATSLRTTGGALSDFAQAEVQNPHAAATSSSVPFLTQPPIVTPLRPPPPPDGPPSLDMPPHSVLHRAASMPEYVVAKPKSKPTEAIIEEEEDEGIEEEGSFKSSSSSRRRGAGDGESVGERMMRDEEGPPPLPSPPPEMPPGNRTVPLPPESIGSTYEYIFNTDGMTAGSLRDVEDLRKESEERERVERKVIEEAAKINEIDHSMDAASYSNVVRRGGAGGEGSRRNVKVEVVEEMVEIPQEVVEKPSLPPQQAGGGKMLKRGKLPTSGGGEGKRVGKSLNLLQIFSQLDDCFLKSYESARDVSKMLEAARLHYHSNFADNRGHIDHSAKIMRVITWNRSFRGLPDADSGKDEFDAEENETHATVLDKLLAWEKKLYDEVKAGELMKFEYQRKLAVLNKHKKRGTDSEALEKAKASVSHLHTRYIVDMQSMDSTVAEINRLRDEQLYPKLTELVTVMVTMWETMQVHHENQFKIVRALELVDASQTSTETTDYLYRCTCQLLDMVEDWHLQFAKMISNQKEYIKSLNCWLKLNLVPIESSLKENVSSPPRAQDPPIQRLLNAWHDFLGKLPDDQAKEAIIGFAAVIQAILQHQEDEIKLKQQCNASRKDLETKTRKFKEWYQKHLQQAGPEEVDPYGPENSGHQEMIVDRQFVVELAKKKLEEDEEKYRKQCGRVRDKTIASLQARMPGLFQAMAEFAYSCAAMYRRLKEISHSDKRKQRESTS